MEGRFFANDFVRLVSGNFGKGGIDRRDAKFGVGDEDRLLQVMANLLSNAAKFSPPHHHVEVKVTADEAMLRVAVTDHGPGIPETFRDRVFDKFTQADSSDARRQERTGLGLSISKAIVERHGGAIGFDTEIDRGTTVYFTLPKQGTSPASP